MQKMILLVELVGAKECRRTEAFDKIEKSSLIKQKIECLTVEVPRIKVMRIQKRFKMQLKDREYYVVCDFKIFSKSRLKALICNQQCRYKEESNF